MIESSETFGIAEGFSVLLDFLETSGADDCNFVSTGLIM
jgi:hypothetical protein